MMGTASQTADFISLERGGRTRRRFGRMMHEPIFVCRSLREGVCVGDGWSCEDSRRQQKGVEAFPVFGCMGVIRGKVWLTYTVGRV